MLLTVHVRPNSKVTEIVEWYGDDEVKIRVAAPPTEGKANKELVQFLAKYFKVPKTSIEIKHGATGKVKMVEISK